MATSSSTRRSEGGEAKSLPYPYQRGWSFQGEKRDHGDCEERGAEAIRVSACRTMDRFASLAMTELDRQLRQNNSTGKSPKVCPASLRKIFRFRRRANH